MWYLHASELRLAPLRDRLSVSHGDGAGFAVWPVLLTCALETALDRSFEIRQSMGPITTSE